MTGFQTRKENETPRAECVTGDREKSLDLLLVGR